MSDHHTLPHLHAIMENTDTNDFHLNSTSRWYVPEKGDEIFKEMLYVFGITDDILVVLYDDKCMEHVITLMGALQICRQVNLTPNKHNCYFRYSSIPF